MVLDSSMLFGAFARILSYPQRIFLNTLITDEEIQKTLFSLEDNKAPSPDGFNVRHFKKSWSIFCPDTINVIQSFFFSGGLLKQVNATTISLILKFLNPSKVNDFRAISCCNTVYKCIAKLIANRIKEILLDLVGPFQSAFVEGRNTFSRAPS
jgi:hypothetical protein